MKVSVRVGQNEAIRAGRNEFGVKVVDIDVSTLTEDERGVMALLNSINGGKQLYGFYKADNDLAFSGITSNGAIPDLDEATIDKALGLLRWLVALRKEVLSSAAVRMAKHKADVDAAVAAILEIPIEGTLDWRLGGVSNYDKTAKPTPNNSANADAWKDPRVSDKLAAILAAQVNAKEKKEAAEKAKQAELINEVLQRDPGKQLISYSKDRPLGNRYYTGNHFLGRSRSQWETLGVDRLPEILAFIQTAEDEADRLNEAETKEIQCIEESQTAQIAAWVAANGTGSQAKRLAVGLLPDDEIINLIREAAYKPLENRPRFEKLSPKAVCVCGYETCKVDFEVDDAETATEQEFIEMEEIQKLLPAAKVLLRVHQGRGSECEGIKERKSIKVALTVGAFVFTREYAV